MVERGARLAQRKSSNTGRPNVSAQEEAGKIHRKGAAKIEFRRCFEGKRERHRKVQSQGRKKRSKKNTEERRQHPTRISV